MTTYHAFDTSKAPIVADPAPVSHSPMRSVPSSLGGFTAEDWALLPSIITEDDTPVDNFLSAKNQRLLVDILYSTWIYVTTFRFLADSNVGVFATLTIKPIVPDVFLSLDIPTPDTWWDEDHRSYFVQEFGKPPDVVIEIVSNTHGGEDSEKLTNYALMEVPYYVIYDPYRKLSTTAIRAFERNASGVYTPLQKAWFPNVGLGVRVWTGEYEQIHSMWLRWCDAYGNIIPTGKERADQEAMRANQEAMRANKAEERSRQDRERARQDREQARLTEERNKMLEAELRRLRGSGNGTKP